MRVSPIFTDDSLTGSVFLRIVISQFSVSLPDTDKACFDLQYFLFVSGFDAIAGFGLFFV